jgi:hypothetical protein
VATTDFLLTIENGLHEIDKAIAIKPAADLASERVLEKLEIERVYWTSRNIEWQILTEKQLPLALVKNTRWLQPHLNLPASGEFTLEQIQRVRTVMEQEITNGSLSLADIAALCDERLGLMPGAALCVSRHLIGIGIWSVDLMVDIDPRKPLRLRTNGGANAIAA